MRLPAPRGFPLCQVDTQRVLFQVKSGQISVSGQPASARTQSESSYLRCLLCSSVQFPSSRPPVSRTCVHPQKYVWNQNKHGSYIGGHGALASRRFLPVCALLFCSSPTAMSLPETSSPCLSGCFGILFLFIMETLREQTRVCVTVFQYYQLFSWQGWLQCLCSIGVCFCFCCCLSASPCR